MKMGSGIGDTSLDLDLDDTSNSATAQEVQLGTTG